MAARPGRRRSALRGARREAPERVTFNDDDFNRFFWELRRRFPDEWIALAMGETDPETGLTHGEILAHDISHAHVFDEIVVYRRSHPETEVRFFTTGIGHI
jgi:hypothetical protein